MKILSQKFRTAVYTLIFFVPWIAVLGFFTYISGEDPRSLLSRTVLEVFIFIFSLAIVRDILRMDSVWNYLEDRYWLSQAIFFLLLFGGGLLFLTWMNQPIDITYDPNAGWDIPDCHYGGC